MPWTERQRAMLREMGVHLWAREADASEGASVESALMAPVRAERGDGNHRGDRRDRDEMRVPVAPEPSPAAVRLRPVAAPTARGAGSSVDRSSLALADWLVVGDAFDAADPQQEQLLDNMLRAIGVKRSAPTRAGRAAFFALAALPASTAATGATAASSTPAASDEAAALAAAIEAVAPRCVIALGRAAAAALLGSDAPLGSWRGRCHERGARPVVVTFALAFLLRHPAEKAKAWDDLCLAVRSLAPAPA